MNRQKIRVSQEDVILAPHRGKVGDLRPLVSLIETSDGELLPPAVVRDRRTQKYVVIGGERRWRAAVRSKLPLHVIICDVWPDYVAWAALDKIRENPAFPSMPMPITDVVAVTDSLTRYLRPGRDEHMDETVSEHLGVRAARLGEARSLKRIKDGNNPDDIQRMVDAEWELVARGEASPSAAFQRIRRAQAKRDAPPADAAVQRRKLAGAASVCTGLVDGLANFGEVSADITPAEAQEMVKRLGEGRRALEYVIRKLQGVTA